MSSAPEIHLNKRLEQLRPILLHAGDHVERMRRENHIKTAVKGDQSPVTNADIWANEYLKEQIFDLFPNELYIGEEDQIVSYTEQEPVIWYIDPIDGTRQFIDGTAPYYMMIGLALHGEPVLGMVYEPEKRRLIYGIRDEGVFIQWNNHEPARPEVNTRWNTHLPLVIKGADRNFYHSFEKETGIRRIGHIADMHNALAPLEARAQGMVSRRKTWLWDYCAPAAIMAAAGYTWGCYNENKPVKLNFGECLVDINYVLPPDIPAHIKHMLLPKS